MGLRFGQKRFFLFFTPPRHTQPHHIPAAIRICRYRLKLRQACTIKYMGNTKDRMRRRSTA